MRKVIYQLEPALPSIHEKFPSINWGGCGVFANLLTTELDKLGVKYKIIWIGNNPNDKKQIKKIFKEKGDKVILWDFNEIGIGVAHFMVKIGRKFVDASGVYKSLNDTEWWNYRLRCEVTKENLNSVSVSHLGWNNMFDRKQIPRVEREVKSLFKKIAI